MNCNKITFQSRGFSLLEIVITLSIIVLFMTSAASLITKRSNPELEEFTVQFTQLARNTKTLASKSDQSLYLLFTPSKIQQSYSKRGEDATPYGSVKVPEGLSVFLKQKRTPAIKNSKWKRVTNENKHEEYWLFSRSGVCEPIEIKFVMGDSERQFEYDPLSAYPVE